MKLLVTGGDGFIGSNFILHTLKNFPKYEIINLDAGFYGSNNRSLAVSSTGSGSGHLHNMSANFSGDATSVLQPYLALIYIIKT